MKSHARVTVIGGGIFGVSTLYHLAKEGWRDAALVEKGELTSGTTWHAAGQCPHFIGDLNLARLHHYGIELYRTFENQPDRSTGWRAPGGIRLARDQDELDWHKYVAGIAKQVGYELHVVGIDEIRQIHPFLETFDVVGGAYTPSDGYVDPARATQAIAAAARELGAEIYRHTRVTSIDRSPSGEWQIETEKGRITCEHLVLACGFYSPQVGAWLGLKIPTVNMVHQYLITEPVEVLKGRPKELPVLRDPGSSSYIRQDQQGLLGGPYETQGAKSVYSEGVPWSFDHELLEPELDRISP